MASTLYIPTCPSDSLQKISFKPRAKIVHTYWAFSTNDDHLGGLSESLTVQLTTLDTSASCNSTAGPITRTSVFLDELDVPEAVSVDDKRSKASGATPVLG